MNLDRAININLTDVSSKSFNFKNLNLYYKFLKRQASFWSTQQKSAGNKLHLYMRSSGLLQTAVQQIESWEQIDSWNDAQLQRQLNQMQQQHLSHIHTCWLWSDHEFVPKYIECHQPPGSEEVAEAFVNFVLTGTVKANTKAGLSGALLGYEYTFQNTDLAKRRKSERATIARLRDELLEANQQLVSQTENNQNNWTEWYQHVQNIHSSWRGRTKKHTRNLLKVSANMVRKQQDDLENKFNHKIDVWQERVNELEATYQEKLRLEKPAEYWSKSAKKLRLQGIIFTTIILLMAVTGFIWLADTFRIWLISGATPISLNSIQGIVLFTASAALFAYGLRVLSRLTFSSFHLMRDAEEREQLTYLYLSLSNESAVDEKSREIVLQALFSRSETGLLANESGPTMPGAADLIRAISRSKSS